MAFLAPRRLGLWLLFAWLVSTSLHAQPARLTKLPPALEPWREWVLQGHEEERCPRFGLPPHDEPLCVWPATLTLALEPKGASFVLDAVADAPGWLPLPGDARHWPQHVRVGGKAAVVVEQPGPSLYLEAGHVRVEGAFAWDDPPASLAVPPMMGLVTLRTGDRPAALLNRDNNGQVWLHQPGTGGAAEEERFELTVFRQVTDEVPLTLTTQLLLNVAGKGREVLLGKVIAPEFLPLALESPLPARWEPDGRLRLQVRPGVWTLTLRARSQGPVTTLTRPDPEGLWREGDEVWSFEARNDLRLVTVEGAPSVDPQQTSMPKEWQSLPAYAVPPGGKLMLREKQRGSGDLAPDSFSLTRDLWLDFNGQAFTFRDTLRGSVRRSWRLDMGPGFDLGRVAMAERDVVLTRSETRNLTGVELRHGTLNLQADGRTARTTAVGAVGWDHDVEHLETTLHLPPGWELAHALGVDAVSDSWVTRWRLLEIFLAIVLSLGFGRLFGTRWGVVAALALVLSLTRDDAVKWWWLVPLVLEAIARWLHGTPRRVVRGLQGAAAACLAILLVPFAVHEVRVAMYPALGTADELPNPPKPVDLKDMGTQQESSQAPPPPVASVAEAGASAPSPKKIEKAPREDSDEHSDSNPQAPSAPWSSLPGNTKARTRSYNTSVYDPNALVQTGPGVPTWNWHAVQLRFNGPVRRDQTLTLWLLSPGTLFVLAWLRVAALALLVSRIFRSLRPDASLPPPTSPGAASPASGPPLVAGTLLGLLLTLTLAPTAAHAQPAVPSSDLLTQLEERLTARPLCSPHCAELSRLELEATGSSLRLRLEVGALAPAVVRLPGKLGAWEPDVVRLNGKAAALRRSPEGHLLVEVPAGRHVVDVMGTLPARSTVSLELPDRPRLVRVRSLQGWSLDGLHENGQADDTLQLTRTEPDLARGDAGRESTTLPPFLLVDRTLHIGLDWHVETRISRLSPADVAVVAEVPLLLGESVTSADVRVEKGRVLVNLPRGASDVSFRSVLAEQSPLVLTAPTTTAWTETWHLDVGPLWHANLTGIPAVHHQHDGVLQPEWRPWPGEQVRIEIRRPEGAAGQTLTCDQSTLTVTPGQRATDVTLELNLRSSRGGEHAIELPAGSELRSVTIGSELVPLALVGRTLTLPLRPGATHALVQWREPRGVQMFYTPSPVDLKTPSVNAKVIVKLTELSRWVLWLRGARLGPAVLFWSFLLVLVGIAYGLSRLPGVPLRWWHWVLLGVGLSQTSVWIAALFAAWLLALGWRRRASTLRPLPFNLLQLALVGLTVLAASVLVGALYQGLLGAPDMHVQGPGASRAEFAWYEDRVATLATMPTVVSVPLFAYRLAMLAWALWLASAVMQWVKWGWENAGHGGFWKPFPPLPQRPPPP